MRQTVVGVFNRYAEAQHAAQQLRESGFGDSVYVTESLGEDGSTASTSTSTATPERDEGVLAHIRQFFSGLFGDDDTTAVRPYADAVRRGGAVVRVEVDEERDADSARGVLESAGAVDVGDEDSVGLEPALGGLDTGSTAAGDTTSRIAADSAPMTGTTAAADMPSSAGRVSDEQVIPVVQENLQVGKRRVATGGVRVFARTVETPVHESLDLRTERAVVERTPVDRPATSADLDRDAEQTIEVRESVEEPMVQKEARVVEEVRVGKVVEQRTEQVDDSVRRTEVQVEPLQATQPGSGSRGLDTGSAMEDEGARFRRHFDANFASSGSRYEDYEPAYQYGRSMSDDPRYSARDWDVSEPDLRRNWESRYPGSAWDRFKAAVRHGWERMTD